MTRSWRRCVQVVLLLGGTLALGSCGDDDDGGDGGPSGPLGQLDTGVYSVVFQESDCVTHEEVNSDSYEEAACLNVWSTGWPDICQVTQDGADLSFDCTVPLTIGECVASIRVVGTTHISEPAPIQRFL